MIRPVTAVVMLLCLAVAFWLAAAFHRKRTPGQAPAVLGILEIVLVAHAVLDGIHLGTGHRPPNLATHLAYLGCSVGFIPMLANPLTFYAEDVPSGAKILVATVTCIALTVVLSRMWVTA